MQVLTLVLALSSVVAANPALFPIPGLCQLITQLITAAHEQPKATAFCSSYLSIPRSTVTVTSTKATSTKTVTITTTTGTITATALPRTTGTVTVTAGVLTTGTVTFTEPARITRTSTVTAALLTTGTSTITAPVITTGTDTVTVATAITGTSVVTAPTATLTVSESTSTLVTATSTTTDITDGGTTTSIVTAAPSATCVAPDSTMEKRGAIPKPACISPYLIGPLATSVCKCLSIHPAKTTSTIAKSTCKTVTSTSQVVVTVTTTPQVTATVTVTPKGVATVTVDSTVVTTVTTTPLVVATTVTTPLTAATVTVTAQTAATQTTTPVTSTTVTSTMTSTTATTVTVTSTSVTTATATVRPPFQIFVSGGDNNGHYFQVDDSTSPQQIVDYVDVGDATSFSAFPNNTFLLAGGSNAGNILVRDPGLAPGDPNLIYAVSPDVVGPDRPQLEQLTCSIATAADGTCPITCSAGGSSNSYDCGVYWRLGATDDGCYAFTPYAVGVI